MFPLKDDNPTRRTPVVTVTLIALNVIVYLWEALLPPDLRQAVVFRFGVVPALLSHADTAALMPPPDLPPVLTLLTSMFLHGGFLHVGGNMLYLWIFGNNIEDVLGHARFLCFYLLCGLIAAVAQVAMAPASLVPMVGASGAIAGVLGGYAVRFPRARVLTVIPIIFLLQLTWVPAILVLGLWFVLQLFNGLGGLADVRATRGMSGGVAFFAHIGGFVAGMLLLRVFEPPAARSRVRVVE